MCTERSERTGSVWPSDPRNAYAASIWTLARRYRPPPTFIFGLSFHFADSRSHRLSLRPIQTLARPQRHYLTASNCHFIDCTVDEEHPVCYLEGPLPAPGWTGPLNLDCARTNSVCLSGVTEIKIDRSSTRRCNNDEKSACVVPASV